MKKVMKILIFLLCVFCICLFFDKVRIQEEVVENEQPLMIKIDDVTFDRINRKEIQVYWSDEYDEYVKHYIIQKRELLHDYQFGEWQTVGTMDSDKKRDGNDHYYLDEVLDDKPVQFEYRINMELDDGVNFLPVDGKSILASNVKICIDPGHFDIAREVADADEYQYVEGNFMLDVGLSLKQILKEQYGIDVCMTRDSGTITIDGYKDEELDSSHLSLRGEFASKEDCDLFLSLHSNSNEEDANGYPTYFQPLEINKPVLLINTVAKSSDLALSIANNIGKNLAQVNFELGLASTADFNEVQEGNINEWTKEYNDGIEKIGTILCRTGKKGDYYGILRGASNVNVPGIIIEHGFHSVSEVRKAATIGNLCEAWAIADAKGIAAGYGFVSFLEKPLDF